MATEQLNEVLTAAEAAALWGLDDSTVKKACQKGRIEARKSGRVWLITRTDMEKVYGPQPGEDDKDA
jgi:excisionase family DNA binding protein